MGAFVKELIRAVEAEREAEVQAVRKEMRVLSGTERERKGRAVLGLRGKKTGEIFDQVVVRFGRQKEIKTEMRVGDVVVVSRGDPLRSDLIGTVVRVGKRFMDVALPAFPEWAKKDVRIDLYADDTTFERWTDVLTRLPESARRALEFALGVRKPEKIRVVKISPITNIDSSKKAAVERALGSKDFFIIHGPFGTGKTTAVTETILQLVERGNKVLATAETNVAVDNIVERLHGKVRLVRIGNPARVSKALLETTLHAEVSRHPRFKEVEKLKTEIEALIKGQEKLVKPTPGLRRGLTDEQILELAEKKKGSRGISASTISSMAEWIKIQKKVAELKERLRETEEDIAREVIASADVVLTTNSSAALEIVPDSFDVAVIDEASQATVPSTLIPISKAKRFILAGDHKQLPPTVKSLRAKILEKTLFEMLIDRYPDHSSMLEVQYRMNETLADFPSAEFYNGRVRTADSVKNISLADFRIPDSTVIEFIDTVEHPRKREHQKKWSESFYNPLEAEIVCKKVKELLQKGVRPEWVGVITPYDEQKEFLRRTLPESVEVNTVDGYQGREKEVIVISFVRSNPERNVGFLKDVRRLNVALTRAKRKLVIVGDSETLSSEPVFRRLVQYVKERGKYLKYVGC